MFGAHRKPEAVIIVYDQYELMREIIKDLAIAQQVCDRDARDSDVRIGIDELAAELGIDLG